MNQIITILLICSFLGSFKLREAIKEARKDYDVTLVNKLLKELALAGVEVKVTLSDDKMTVITMIYKGKYYQVKGNDCLRVTVDAASIVTDVIEKEIKNDNRKED